MADLLTTIVDSIHPAASGIGILVSDQAWVLFNREIDQNSIKTGNFFLVGPDFDTMSGPDLHLFHNKESFGTESEILQSPGFHGFVPAEITFKRISLTTTSEVSTLDSIASGLLFRTKAILTPNNRLQANTEYQVYLVGNEVEDPELITGISTRTIYDPLTSGTNTGTGSISFDGSYTGNSLQDTYHIQITTAGTVDTAKFKFWTDIDPTEYGPFKTKQSGVLLSDGIMVYFSEGDYVVGDTWIVRVKSRDYFNGNLVWSFKTGSGSILEIPTSISTSILGDPIVSSTVSTTASTFSVSSTDPEDKESNVSYLPLGPYNITAEFNSDIDASTVISGIDISVFSEPVTGETSGSAALGNLIVEPSVSGSILTLTVASGQLHTNELITVTLDKTIKNTLGISLGSNYVFTFTTTYNPMYCTYRRLQLMIGAYINELEIDTVNLAIHFASLESDSYAWNKENLDDEWYKFARSQWVCCRAAEILLMNVLGKSGDLKAKSLGDLKVEYNTSNNSNIPLQKAQECLAKWEGALIAGGRQVQSPSMVVKGEYDPDRPPVGRGWVHSRGDIAATPVSNNKYLFNSSRRYRNIYTKFPGSK